MQKTYTYTIIRRDWYGPENRLSFHFRHKWSGMISAKHITKMPPNVSKDSYGCHAWTQSVMKQETYNVGGLPVHGTKTLSPWMHRSAKEKHIWQKATKFVIVVFSSLFHWVL